MVRISNSSRMSLYIGRHPSPSTQGFPSSNNEVTFGICTILVEESRRSVIFCTSSVDFVESFGKYAVECVGMGDHCRQPEYTENLAGLVREVADEAFPVVDDQHGRTSEATTQLGYEHRGDYRCRTPFSTRDSTQFVWLSNTDRVITSTPSTFTT